MALKINIYGYDPPPALVEQAKFRCDNLSTLEEIQFTAFAIKGGSPGTYNPVTNKIVIDLHNCLTVAHFMNLGMNYLPSVWFNMLWALFHEAEHARQLELKPGLALLKTLPPEYEAAADHSAAEEIINWANNGTIPIIEEMGWVSEKLKGLVNHHYSSKAGDMLLKEIGGMVVGGVANLDTFLARRNKDFNKKEAEHLIEEVDKGEIGVIDTQGNKFLTAADFFGSGIIMSLDSGSWTEIKSELQSITQSGGI